MSVQDVINRFRRHAWYGAAEYYLQPGRRSRLGGSFNGQQFRRQIFKELVRVVGFDAIVECGTFRGETTGYLHEISGTPVQAVEADARYFGFSRTRHAKNPAITVVHSDSRSALKEFVIRPNANRENAFVYLDAHWFADLPLREEVEILFNSGIYVVAMVDDFRVPGDPGYSFDDYGPGKALTDEYLDTADVTGVRRFYPTAPSETETGARRGCVVLAADEVADLIAAECRTISEHTIAARKAA